MSAITSKVQICNLALGYLGNKGTVQDIDSPQIDKEIIFAQWYDISRQTLLKLLMPNFALSRKLVAELIITPAFGYDKVFEYPSDCLKVLGFGNIDEKGDFKYTIEGDQLLTNDEWENGLQLRYIKDITTITSMSSEFIMTFALYLATKTCLQITQDRKLLGSLLTMLPSELSMVSGLNAQENPPIRKSVSRWRAARYADVRMNATKE
jgi:hypothetical protein